MKTLICALNSKYIHSSLAPWCLYAACKANCKKKHTIRVIEGTVNEKADAILKRITDEKPDSVAFCVYIWNRVKVLELCGKIKKLLPGTAVILGGPEVAYNQKEVLEENSFVDFVLSGEGEIILPRLLDSLAGGLSPEVIDGVSFRDDNRLIIRNEAIGTLFDYPSPYCKEYFNSLGGRIAYLETSRGCPFSCAYCLSGRCGKVKFKPMEQTKKEILLLAASGTKTVKFVDRTFNCNNDRAVEILRFINDSLGKEIPRGVCFHFEISADILKDSFLQQVSRAEKGLFQFEIGIQSMNEDTLRAIGRKSNLMKLSENVRRLIAFGNCHIHTDLIAGLPKETLQSFIHGFNESYALGADMLQLGFLKLLHGSALRDKEAPFGCRFSPEPPYEVISTDTMSDSELQLLHTFEKEVDRLHNSGRFRRTLSYALEGSGLTPFELFRFIGEELESILPGHSAPLDAYTNALFAVLSRLEGINEGILRDKMLCDRITSNNSGIIPKSLYIADSHLKRVKHLLSLEFPAEKGTSRNVGILYTEKRVIFCDYGEYDPVKKEYAVQSKDFDFFGETFFDFDIDK